tara:strand:- start:321 stop:539 length:219 start_codon:yes stop_codon:yes gene_type:complete
MINKEKKEEIISDIVYNIINVSDKFTKACDNETDDAISYQTNLDEFFEKILSKCDEKDLIHIKYLSEQTLRI